MFLVWFLALKTELSQGLAFELISFSGSDCDLPYILDVKKKARNYDVNRRIFFNASYRKWI